METVTYKYSLTYFELNIIVSVCVCMSVFIIFLVNFANSKESSSSTGFKTLLFALWKFRFEIVWS